MFWGYLYFGMFRVESWRKVWCACISGNYEKSFYNFFAHFSGNCCKFLWRQLFTSYNNTIAGRPPRLAFDNPSFQYKKNHYNQFPTHPRAISLSVLGVVFLNCVVWCIWQIHNNFTYKQQTLLVYFLINLVEERTPIHFRNIFHNFDNCERLNQKKNRSENFTKSQATKICSFQPTTRLLTFNCMTIAWLTA